MKKKLITNDLNSISGPRGSAQSRDRFQEALDHLVPGDKDSHDTTNRWSGRETLSIELEATKTLKLQNELDDMVEQENVFPEDEALVTRRGQPPCKRVRKEG